MCQITKNYLAQILKILINNKNTMMQKKKIFSKIMSSITLLAQGEYFYDNNNSKTDVLVTQSLHYHID